MTARGKQFYNYGLILEISKRFRIGANGNRNLPIFKNSRMGMNVEKENTEIDSESQADTTVLPEGEAVSEAIGEEAGTADEGNLTGDAGDASDLLKNLDEAQAQAREFQDRLLRVVADQENYRKRAVREREQMRRFGAMPLIEDFLPVVDNLLLGLETARQHPEASAVTEGFSMVVTQIESILKKHSVEPIAPCEGDPFDPNVHDAVAHSPDEKVGEGKIITVTRGGYMLHDRLIRPASVVVSSGPPEAVEGE